MRLRFFRFIFTFTEIIQYFACSHPSRVRRNSVSFFPDCLYTVKLFLGRCLHNQKLLLDSLFLTVEIRS